MRASPPARTLPSAHFRLVAGAADTRVSFRNQVPAHAVGEKSVELLPLKDVTAVTGYVRGGCTAIGMKKQYVTRIDAGAASLDKMVVSGGKIGVQLTLKPEDLKKAAKAEFAEVI